MRPMCRDENQKPDFLTFQLCFSLSSFLYSLLKRKLIRLLDLSWNHMQKTGTFLKQSFMTPKALPLYLDRIFNPFVAIVLSVTFVLAFGEVIPQAICTRYGLAVGANLVWLVRILMIICYLKIFTEWKAKDTTAASST